MKRDSSQRIEFWGMVWLWLLLLAAGWPTLRWYVLRMRDGSDEPFGLIALAACAFFARGWRNWSLVSMRRLGVAALVLGVMVLTPPQTPPLLRALLWLIAVGAIAARRACWAALLTYSLPVMASAQFFAGYPVRVAVTWAAAGLLRLLGLAVLPNATVLSWHHQSVMIDAPCSGLQMAWLAGLLALILANAHELCAQRTGRLLLVAAMITFVANALRAAALFLLETQLRVSEEWMHDMIGLSLFAGVVGSVLRAAARERGLAHAGRVGAASGEQNCEAVRGEVAGASRATIGNFSHAKAKFFVQSGARPAALFVFFVLCSLNVGKPLLAASTGVSKEPLQTTFPGWNAAPIFRANASRLRAIDLDPKTLRFAADFPGKIGVFSDGPHTYILRWVMRPTRKLHSSADCLRAAGFEVAPGRAEIDAVGAVWAHFTASHGEEIWNVSERIVAADGDAWTDVSAWFWENLFPHEGTTGPWWAVTRLERKSPS